MNLFKRKNALKEKVDNFFKKKNEKFFKRKQPKSTSYPYKVHDPYLIFGENSGYEHFYLVGENWTNNQDLPIAIVWGMNDWKLGFISDYLPEYRTAFVPRKSMSKAVFGLASSFKQKPEVFIVWGYTESALVRFYSKVKNIPIWRMEDAFLRSLNLGASHSTPYSLVLDKSGFYYNCYKASDLEKICNEYDFSSSKELISKSKLCIEILKNKRLSKYNPIEISEEQSDLSIKTKKRIAVIGQVDKDASLRYGNPDGWDSESLIKLARYENPTAEILYRPHPEVYKGYQKSAFKKKRISKIATVVAPSQSFVDFIDSIDHVYTISSLAGFESLLREKKVTTVGAPFYSGWGLTDDRVIIQRRDRSLKLEELFACAYLLYPRYLKSEDGYNGFLTASHRIVSDKIIEKNKILRKFDFGQEINFSILTVDEIWTYLSAKVTKGLFDIKDVNLLKSCFIESEGDYHNLIVICFFLGYMEDEKVESFLLLIRDNIDVSSFSLILNALYDLRKGYYLYSQYSWLMAKEFDLKSIKEKLDLLDVIEKSEIDSEVVSEIGGAVAENNREYVLNAFEISLGRKNYDECLHFALKVLVSSRCDYHFLFRLCEILEVNFQYVASFNLYKKIFYSDFSMMNRKSILAYIRVGSYLHHDNIISKDEYFAHMLICAILKPESIENLQSSIISSGRFGDDAKEYYNLILDVVDKELLESPSKVKYLLEIGKLDRALSCAESVIELGDNSDKALLAYSTALSVAGHYDKAINVISERLKSKWVEPLLRELIRLLNIVGDYNRAKMAIEIAEKRNLRLNSSVLIPIYLGLGEIKRAYSLYLQIPFRDLVVKYFPDRFINENLESDNEKLLVLSVFGPGDEIRFSSIYLDIKEHYKSCDVIYTCDERLYSLFSRSFDELTFIPVKRIRDYSSEVLYSDYSLLPGSDLCTILDNRSLYAVNKADRLSFATDFIHKFRADYGSFPGLPYLKANQKIVDEYRSFLPQDKLCVGISWRSSLNNSARGIHYLSIEQLSTLFSLDGVQFINMQYDDVEDEIEWVNQEFPGKLINFKNLDQFNDFDGVAALMTCLDLLIAPCNSVAELAGALGIKTLLFSNSAELSWRKCDASGKDVWHGNTTIVEGDEIGNKDSVVRNIVTHIEQLIKNDLSK